MAVSFRLYQIEYDPSADGGNGDLVILDEISDIDERIVEVGDIEESVEWEKAQYRIGNVSLTVRGLAKDKLRGAGDFSQPWVLEVYEDDNVIFAGPVLSEDAEYNAKTQRTSLEAASWLYILKETGETPARYIYETEVTDVFFEDGDNKVRLATPLVQGSGTQAPQAGDVMIVEKNGTEFRQVLNTAATVTLSGGTDVRLSTYPFVSNELLAVSGDAANDITVYTNEGAGNGRVRITFEIDDADAYRKIIRQYPDQSGNEEQAYHTPRKGDEPLFHVEDSSGDRTYELRIRKFFYTEDQKVRFNTLFQFIPNLSTGFSSGSTYSIEYAENNVPAVSEGDKVKFLGRGIYGYQGEGGPLSGNELNYKADEIISALFQVNDIALNERKFGVLGYVFDTITVNPSGTDDISRLDPELQYPKKPLEALRFIQQTTETFFRLKPKTATNSNSNEVPAFDAELISRRQALSGATSQGDVSEWTENVSDETVRAVVVNNNEEYLKEENGPEYVGFYFDGIENLEGTTQDQEDARRERAVPEGEGVIEIEVGMLPSKEGYLYGGNDGEVVNDNRLRAIAKRFYDHFNDVVRPVSTEVLVRNQDLLGQYITFTGNSDINESVLITKQTRVVQDRAIRTSYEGRIGSYVEPTATDPTAKINGLQRVRVASGNDATVNLTAQRSFDNDEGPLTFTWERKEKGQADTAYVSVGGGVAIEDTFVGVTSNQDYIYRVTVTNSETTLTDQAEFLVQVTTEVELDATPPSSILSYTKEQEGGAGRVYVQPKADDIIAKVEFRYARGAELTNSDTFTEITEPFSAGSDFDAGIDTGTSPSRWYAEVDLDEKHVSNIELRITFTEDTGYGITTRPFTFDFDIDPDLRHGDLTLVEVEDDNPNTTLEVIVDEDSTGFEYRTATTGVVQPVTPPSSGDYSAWDTTYQNSGNLTSDDPANPILTAPRFETLWVQVRAYDSDSGKYSQIKTYSIPNTAFYSGAEGVWSDVGGGEIRYDAGGVQIGTNPITSGNGAGDLSVQVGVTIGNPSSNRLILDATGVEYTDDSGNTIFQIDNTPELALYGENTAIRFIDDVGSDFEYRLIEDGGDFKIQRAGTVGGSYVDYLVVDEGGLFSIPDGELRIAQTNAPFSTTTVDPTLTLGGTGTGQGNFGTGIVANYIGSASDHRLYLQGGHGRAAYVWNAAYDDDTGNWTSLVGSEAHSLIGVGNADPGGINGGNVTLAVGGSNASPGDPISWTTFILDLDGSIDFPGNIGFDGSQTFTSTGGFSIESDNNAWVRFDQADDTEQRYFDIEHGSSENTVARFANDGTINFHGTGGTHALDVHAPTGDIIAIGDVGQDNNNSLVFIAGGEPDTGAGAAYVGTRHGEYFSIRLDNQNAITFRPYGFFMQNGFQNIRNCDRIQFAENSSTTPKYDLVIDGIGGYNPGGVVLRADDNPAAGDPIFTVMSSGGADRLRVEHNGVTVTANDFEASGEVTAFGNSDRRKKDHLTPIQNPLEMLRDIKGYEYQWNENERESKRWSWSYGIVAQEIQKHLPHAVRTNETDGYLAVESRQLHGFHVAVDRAQQAEIERLKRRVKRLEEKLYG